MQDMNGQNDGMNDQDRIDAYKYRFSGYQMPKVRLDDGFEYDISPGVHPYYVGQPEFWSTRATFAYESAHKNAIVNDQTIKGNYTPISEEDIQKFKETHKNLFKPT